MEPPGDLLCEYMEPAADQAEGASDDASCDDGADAGLGALTSLCRRFVAAIALAAADAQDLRGGYTLGYGRSVSTTIARRSGMVYMTPRMPPIAQMPAVCQNGKPFQ